MDNIFTELELPTERTAIFDRAQTYVIVRLAFDALLLPLSFLSLLAQGQYPTYWFVGIDALVLAIYWLFVRRWPSVSTYLVLLVPAVLIILLDFNQGQVLLFTWFLLIPLASVGGMIMGRTGFNSLVTLTLMLVFGAYVAYVMRMQTPVVSVLSRSALLPVAISMGIVLLVLNALVETLIVHMFQNQEQLVQTKAQLFQALSELESSRSTMRSVQQRMLRSERLNTIGQVASQLNKSIQAPLKRVQQMLDSSPTEQWNRETVELIRQDLRDIVRVTEGLQHIADLKAPQIKPVNLDDLVLGMLSQMRPPQGIHLHYKEAVLIPPIQADPEQLQVLIHQLLENAFQAIPQGGEVEIELQPSPEGVRLSVSDTGPGIPPDQLEQIFEPLFTTQQKGIGLGLVICQQIVQLHGGSIKAENAPEGGARFNVYLPRMPHNMEQELVQDVSA
ncbi:MAG: hypothetical protein GXP37_01625 [Chloroflexi bacterium]|nr:hypothetical protein [Chloroflexota bacterium]